MADAVEGPRSPDPNRPTWPTWPPGYDRLLLDTVDSTNAEAGRRAAAGMRGPVWIAARQQRAGRGRGGRVWLTEPGNLAASLLSPAPPGDAARTATLAFVAGLAVADLCEREYGLDARLKWPNDVLVAGRKIAGILIENSGGLVVVGIGVNLLHAPGELPAAGLAAISVREATGRRPEFSPALAALARSWAERYRQWHAGFAGIRAAWLARAAFLGQTVAVRLPEGTARGVFEGIDAGGALLLATPAGRRRFSSAEMFAA